MVSPNFVMQSTLDRKAAQAGLCPEKARARVVVNVRPKTAREKHEQDFSACLQSTAARRGRFRIACGLGFRLSGG
jgi:hypothetical protein